MNERRSVQTRSSDTACESFDPSANEQEESTAEEVDDSSYHIKAINRDNCREGEEVIELFRREYGLRYPLKQVYDLKFWCPQTDDLEIEDALTSLVAVRKGRLVAHIAYRADKSGRSAEIVLPAVDPDFKRDIYRLSIQFWNCLKNQAIRQGWTQVIHYIPASDGLLQAVARRCFQSQEVAFIPFAEKSTKPETAANELGALTLLYNRLETQHELITVFPPKSQLKALEQLYRKLNLPRALCNDPTRKRGFDTSPYPAEEPIRLDSMSLASTSGLLEGFQVHLASVLDLQRIVLYPDLLHNSDPAASKSGWIPVVEEMRSVARAEGVQQVVEVSLTASECPAVCAILEERGYVCCGVRPETDDNDFILYTPGNVQQIERLQERFQNDAEFNRSEELFDQDLPASLLSSNYVQGMSGSKTRN